MEQDRQSKSPYYSRPGQDASLRERITPEEKPNGLARASMILGIIALVSFFTFTLYPPIIFGSIAIILALLSRGASFKMHSHAKNGIITSVIALGCNIAMFVAVFGLIFGNFEAIYGMSYQEMMESMENGTLDYDELYENIYNNMYENMYEDMLDEMPEEMQDDFREMYEKMYQEMY